jgi:hypothetical protein
MGAKFQLARRFFAAEYAAMQPMTISAAARHEHIDRSTVQRYCRREPGIMVGKKVDLESLKAVIAHVKAGEGRGFPLGRSRLSQWLFKPPRKEKTIVHRRLSKRFEIMKHEIEAMTDEEQVQMLEMGMAALWRCFRRSSFEKVKAKHPEAERPPIV